MRRWPQGPQFQLALQPVQTSSFLGSVFVDDNIGDVASIAITFTRVEVGAFAGVELASEAYLSFTKQLMLTVAIVVAVVVIEAFSLRPAVAIVR